MDLQVEKVVDLHGYLSKFWEHGIRSDGRQFIESRSIAVDAGGSLDDIGSISTANGSALVKLGNTVVVCGIKAEVCRPDAASPSSGFLVVNIDYPPLCGSKFKKNSPNELSQDHSYELHEAVLKAGLVNLTDLCIVPGELVWVLHADIICLNYDGSALDLRLLPVAMNDHGILQESEGDSKSLRVSPIVSVSLGVHNGLIFADLNEDEESQLSCTIRILFDSSLCMKSMDRLGECSMQLFEESIEIAKKLASDRMALLIS